MLKKQHFRKVSKRKTIKEKYVSENVKRESRVPGIEPGSQEYCDLTVLNSTTIPHPIFMKRDQMFINKLIEGNYIVVKSKLIILGE
jgi:hypothetical protein